MNRKQNVHVGSRLAGRIADSPHGFQPGHSGRFPQRRSFIRTSAGPVIRAFRRLLTRRHLRLDADDENVFGADVHDVADSFEEILPVAGDEIVGRDVADRQDGWRSAAPRPR